MCFTCVHRVIIKHVNWLYHALPFADSQILYVKFLINQSDLSPEIVTSIQKRNTGSGTTEILVLLVLKII